jgi:ORF6N domain
MSQAIIPVNRVAQAIRVLRGEKVLLHSDLAFLYGVETRVLNQAVKRVGKHDEEMTGILEAIRQLMARPEKQRREIGFHVRETAPRYWATKRA